MTTESSYNDHITNHCWSIINQCAEWLVSNQQHVNPEFDDDDYHIVLEFFILDIPSISSCPSRYSVGIIDNTIESQRFTRVFSVLSPYAIPKRTFPSSYWLDAYTPGRRNWRKLRSPEVPVCYGREYPVYLPHVVQIKGLWVHGDLIRRVRRFGEWERDDADYFRSRSIPLYQRCWLRDDDITNVTLSDDAMKKFGQQNPLSAVSST